MLPGKKEKASERKEYLTLVLKEEVEFSDERHFVERKGQVQLTADGEEKSGLGWWYVNAS